MIEVKIPAEIQEYKSKLIFGLSVRQVIAIAGALLVGVTVGLLGRGHIPSDILIWIVMLLVVPFAGWGFFTFKGMKFEEFIKAFIAMNFLPQQRAYEDTDMNLYERLLEETLENRIIQQRVDAGEYETDSPTEWRELN